MNLSLICGAIWLIATTVTALFSSKDRLLRRAYLLIGIGLPILGWVIYQNGPMIALFFLTAGPAVVRWPLDYLGVGPVDTSLSLIDWMSMGVMLVSAFVPMIIMLALMRAQKSGAALTLIAILGAALIIAVFGAGRSMGNEMLIAVGFVMLVALPACLGAGAGALLGWLIVRRRLNR